MKAHPTAHSRPVLTEWSWVAGVLIFAAVIAVGATSGNTIFASAAFGGLVLALVVGFQLVAAKKTRDAGDGVNDGAGIPCSGRRMWAPLWISTGWLLGTYGAFRLTGLAAKVNDTWTLTAFVISAAGAFALGYTLRIKSYPAVIIVDQDGPDRTVRANRLVFVSGLYFIAFGMALLAEYGATSLGEILTRIQDPGSSYQAKFSVYAEQQATGRVSAPIQILTLAGCLYGVLAPMLVIHWPKLTFMVRATGVAGLLTYAVYFLFIGTQKGLGDIVVMLGAGGLTGALGTWWGTRTRRGAAGRRRKVMRYAVAAVAAFACYMVSAQAQRAEQFGTRDVTPPNATVAALVGDRAATGVAAALFYPTHGYLGLSYNLGTPFTWTGGLGASPVIASYAAQYLGTPAPATYPARTQARTGWPAGRYWATVYPWLASDLTFPGVLAFMMMFGWFFAKTWFEAAMRRDALALVIFGQLAIAVAYIPANNQLGVSRPSTIGFLTLLGLYVGRSVFRRSGAPPSPATSAR